MKKSKFLCLALVATMSLGLIACGNSKNTTSVKVSDVKDTKEKIKDGGTMVFVSASDPLVLNPFYQNNRITFTVNRALFDPLYVKDGSKITYYLADKLEVSKDKLTYTVKLKDNLKWHDGQKITAEDLMFTLNTALDPKQHIGDRESYLIDGKPVKITKIDDLTVEMKLPKAYIPFEGSLGSIRMIPKHVFQGEKDLEKSTKNNNPVGSGPFKFKEWKKGEALTLERFNDYYTGKPHLEKIVYRIVGDANAGKIAFENGEITAKYVEEKDFNKYSKNEKFKTYKFDECMPEYLLFNTDNKNLKDKKVRQAISYALNKQDILKSVCESLDNVKMANSVFPPTTLYYTDDVEHYDFNLEKAKKLMDEAKVKDITLKFAYVAGSKKDINQMNVMKEQLAKIGIKIQGLPLEEEAFFAQLFGTMKRQYDLVLNAYVCTTDPDSYSGLYVEKGSMNWANYVNRELDPIWKKASMETDDAKRKEMYETLQKKLAEDAVQYNIDYTTSYISTAANIGGVKEAKLVPIYMFEDLSKLYIIEK
ncbi:ABC transporter substrate-binding protein [Clostridium sp. FP1]|uniref:ABC transporter substrate-binding protein n=1 Tax=Clostridium sp. FP1 TaxID=2724076 RepID=UPI0013E92ECD|nr:ABC transporter substrate-binding protein [Clostridium sp. FP1]MBZ9635661.1 ABC transporter substrate-binding protein [Clostridium sp. FP1]